MAFNSLLVMAAKRNNIFWGVVITCYVITVLLCFARVYVYHAYPTYYAEEDEPSLLNELLTVPNFLRP